MTINTSIIYSCNFSFSGYNTDEITTETDFTISHDIINEMTTGELTDNLEITTEPMIYICPVINEEGMFFPL